MKRLRRWFDLVGENLYLRDRVVTLAQECDQHRRELRSAAVMFDTQRELLKRERIDHLATRAEAEALRRDLADVNATFERYVLSGKRGA